MAWDGRKITDRPYFLKIACWDWHSPDNSKAAFRKLFPKSEFRMCQVTSVWEVKYYMVRSPQGLGARTKSVIR